jgi:hypothetical protein
MHKRVLLLALALAAPALADDAPPAIRQFDTATTESLGRAMYEQDQMVWHASDVMMGQYSTDELTAAKAGFWVVDPVPGGWVVRFTRQGDSGPAVFCEVTFRPEMSKTCDKPADTVLSADDLAQLAARHTAIAHVTQPCSHRYNSIVLKDPERDDLLVWAMAATTEPGVIMYGGHYRFTISKNGKDVIAADRLSMSCLAMQIPASSGDQKVLSASFTQLAAPTPVETAVFLNLQYKLPFDIVAGHKMWMIVDGKITEGEPLPPPNR